MDFVDNNIQKVQVQPEDQVYARNEDIKVYGKLVSMSTENVVADSEQIWDETLKKNQSDVNSWVQQEFERYLPLTGGRIDGNLDIDGNLNVYGKVGASTLLTLGDSLWIEEGSFVFEGTDNESLFINDNGLTYAFTEDDSTVFRVKEGDVKSNSISIVSKDHTGKQAIIEPDSITLDDYSTSDSSVTTSISNDEINIITQLGKEFSEYTSISSREIELHKEYRVPGIDFPDTQTPLEKSTTTSSSTKISSSQIEANSFVKHNATNKDVLLGDGSTTDRLIKDVKAAAIQSEYNFNFITTGNVNNFVTIKAATSTTAGVMTAADKTKLDDVPNIYAEKSKTISNITVGNRPNKRGLYIAIDYADRTNPGTTVNIPNATTASDGCMSYEDKNKLDNIENTYLPLSGGTLTGTLRLNDINSNRNGLDINNVNGIQSVDQDKVSTPEVWTTNGNSIPLNIANGIAKLDQNGNIPLKNLGNIDTQIALVVDKLPTTDIKTNKIYLVRKNETGQDNAYIEYVYINNSWEKFGEYTPSIDLSEYSLKSQTVSSAAFVANGGNTQLQLTNADNSKNTISVPLAEEPSVSAGHLTSGQNGFMSVSDKVKLNGIAESANNYVLKKATASDLGGIKIGFTVNSSSKNYPVTLDSNDKAYVHVPWTDTQTDISNCVKNNEDGIINGDLTVNGDLSTSDADIVINSGKLELHSASGGIKFVDNEDSVYISTVNGSANEYFATDGSIQTIQNSYLPLSGGTVTGGITVDGAINTKSNITTDGTVTAKGFVSKTVKNNPHEVWACNGGSINLKTIIAATAVYVHGSIVESIAGSINQNITIDDPDAIIFNKATGSFVAKKGNAYYKYWDTIDNLLISNSGKYGTFTAKKGTVPYHNQLYKFANDNSNIYIANNAGSVPILDIYIN